MGSPSEEIHLQQLQELVEDEDKIVTVPFLANNFGITIQESEKLIKRYLEDQRKLDPEALAVTYVLTGIRKDGQSRAVYMAEESDVPMKIELFEEVISEIVYSVQKSKNLNFNIIGLADWNDPTRISDKPLLGTIATKNYVKRNIVFKKLPAPPPPVLKGKSRFFAPKSESNEKSDVKTSEKAAENNADKKPKTMGGITNMFNNMSASNSKSVKKNDATKPVVARKSKGGLSSFLTKNSSNSLTNGSRETITCIQDNPTKTEDDIKPEVNDLSSFMEVDFDEEMETVKPEVKENSTKISKGKKKSSKRVRDVSEDKAHKKRKRIIERNDSESDDLFENDEDVIEKSDEEPERVPSPVAKLPPAKSKIRKAVDKTYMDEEGFIVTKKEYVYESENENENLEPKPEIEKPKVEEKAKPKAFEKKSSLSSENDISPQKGGKGKKSKKNNLQNQPTLMNFFKKK